MFQSKEEISFINKLEEKISGDKDFNELEISF